MLPVIYLVTDALLLGCVMKYNICLNTFEFYTWLRIILLKVGDIEQNPGPPLTPGTDKRDISRNIDKFFSFVHYNVQSALPKIDLLSSELSNFDVISLTETWLSDNINSQDINITGFHPPFAMTAPMITMVVLQCTLKKPFHVQEDQISNYRILSVSG